jgi:5-methylcytosine-specific restriction endonuclease McrA
MSKIHQALNDYIKQALWATYKKKCFYCNEPLAYKNIHIDHVIPIASFRGREEEMRQNYLLNRDFNFNSLDNFVPSCPSCNYSKKREKELQKGIPIWLDFCKKNKSKILNDAKQIERTLCLDLPDQYREFFLTSTNFSFSILELTKIRKIDIPMYKHLIFNEDYGVFQLTSPIDSTIKQPIRTLAEYENYSNAGYYAYTTPDISNSSVCEACLVFFEMFSNALFIENRMPIEEYLMDLPASILIQNQEDEDTDNNDLIRDVYLNTPNVHIDLDRNAVELAFRNDLNQLEEVFWIKEVLQADFSGNDNREALLFIHYKSEGTLNFTYHVHVSLQGDKWIVIKA